QGPSTKLWVGMTEAKPCPVCTTALEKRSDYGEKVYFSCPRCGLFGLAAHAELVALPALLTTPRKRAVLSYVISRKTLPARPGTLTTVFDAEECERIIKADYLPTPQEQGENVIRWIGEISPDLGHTSHSRRLSTRPLSASNPMTPYASSCTDC
ncbi:MAG: hypothetical protein ACREA0_23155, partial [bacterium]